MGGRNSNQNRKVSLGARWEPERHRSKKGGTEGSLGGGERRGSEDVSAWGGPGPPQPSLPGARGGWLWAGGAEKWPCG